MNGDEAPWRSRVPLVCLHGLAGSARWWDAVLSLLEAGGPVAATDMPGGVTPDELTSWVGARVAGLGSPVDLAGHSLGALVAIRLAATRPGLVRRLVLVAPTGLHPSRSAIRVVPPLLLSFVRTRASLLARLGVDVARAGPVNVLRGGLYAATADATSDLARLDIPTLLVLGERDPLVPVEAGRRWAEALPRARLVVLAGAAHVPMIERPEALARAILAFRDEPLDEIADDLRM